MASLRAPAIDGRVHAPHPPLALVSSPEIGPTPSPGAERLISETVLAAIRDGVVVLRSNGQIAAVNQAMCDMTGFSRDELVGACTPLPYWPPEQHLRILAVRAATTDGREGEFDMTFQRKSGERFPAIVAIGVSREYDARIVVIKDVTERELLTAQLQDAKQDAESARLAFARSAEVIGEFLYSAEVLPDESFVMHAQGPGNAELLGTDPDDPDAPTRTHRAPRRPARLRARVGVREPPAGTTARSSSSPTDCSATTESSAGSAIGLGSP